MKHLINLSIVITLFSVVSFVSCKSKTEEFIEKYDVPDLSKARRVYSVEIQERYLYRDIRVSGKLVDIYKKHNQLYMYFYSEIGSYSLYFVLTTDSINYKAIKRHSNFILIVNLSNIHKWTGGDPEFLDEMMYPVYYVNQVVATGKLIDYMIKD